MWNATLDRRENEVMRALLTLSAGKARFLASPAEMLAIMRGKCDELRLERTLFSLAQDGYFDVICTDRKGGKDVCRRDAPQGPLLCAQHARRPPSAHLAARRRRPVRTGLRAHRHSPQTPHRVKRVDLLRAVRYNKTNKSSLFRADAGTEGGTPRRGPKRARPREGMV